MTKCFSKSILLMAVLPLLTLTGCQDKTPNASEASLDVSNVQGSSFDEPVVVATDPKGTPVDSQTPPDEIPAAVSVAQTPVTIPTAADIPSDIALIPSETPAPAAVSDTPVPAPVNTEVQAPLGVADAGGFIPVSFKTLSSFKYEEPIPAEGEKPEDVENRRKKDQIPAEVKALDGKKAVLEGWMVPMEISEDGSVKSFVLVKTQPQCCFGDMQAMNEWVDVVMKGGQQAEFNVDIPVKVYGDLEVGEKTQDGFVLSVYRMQADRVEL